MTGDAASVFVGRPSGRQADDGPANLFGGLKATLQHDLFGGARAALHPSMDQNLPQ